MKPASRFPIILAVVLSLALAGKVMAAPEDCLTLAVSEEFQDSLSLVSSVSKALENADVCHEMLSLPQVRANAMLLRGEIDGEILRVSHYQTMVGDAAIMVEEPLAAGHGYIVFRKGDPNPLEREVSTLGMVIGTLWPDTLDVTEERLVRVRKAGQLYTLLKEGRITGFLVDEGVYQQMGLTDPEIVKDSAAILTVHAWLHKSRADMVPVLERVFREQRIRTGALFYEGEGVRQRLTSLPGDPVNQKQ